MKKIAVSISKLEDRAVQDTDRAFTTTRFSLADVSITDMPQLVAEVQTSQGKDVVKVYKTPNKDHQHEIRTVAPPLETERIHHNGRMMKTKDSIRSNTSDFLQSINHPDAGSNLHIL